ncbi:MULTISPECIES: hypothetical protein [Streptomyces]|uniref:Uncharacterized protein n=1 Tax=Streptomyces nigrescens TaxID=1920 RepID=A0ABY7J239_STRNI|nr:hypothetical protein [Streptomyces nigrescens]WAU03686.1 hypothetical protein STRNI_001850 [Streptomyces nigrescens]
MHVHDVTGRVALTRRLIACFQQQQQQQQQQQPGRRAPSALEVTV